MKNRKYESMEDFVSCCRKDGFKNFFAFSGDGNAKRACIGEGEYGDTLIAIASCLIDRDDVYKLFKEAFAVATEIRAERKGGNQ